MGEDSIGEDSMGKDFMGEESIEFISFSDNRIVFAGNIQYLFFL